MESALLALFVTAFVTGLSGAASPGPLLTWNIGAAARSGFWAGPRMVLGHAAVEFPLVIGIAFGLGTLVREPRLLGILGLAGAAFLLWMGYGTLRSVPGLPDPLSLRGSDSARGAFREAFGAGVVISLGNPYWILWWATIGAGLVVQSLEFGVAGLLIFFFGHISADLGWYGLVSFAIAKGIRMIGRTGYRILMAVLGITMLILCAFFLFNGIALLASSSAV